MNKFIILALIFFLIQSCETYKPISISEIKKGKTYEITLKNGQSFKTKCEKVDEENVSVLINEGVMVLPKSKIENAKKRKVSTYKLVGGITFVTVGVILLLTNGDDDLQLAN